MFLNKLYSEPAGLFDLIEFKEGINIIFGKKDSHSDAKKSLNGIGKSTTLDLIDFSLLSSFTKEHNSRLYSAKEKGLLKNYSIVLEFEINNDDYIIKRNFEKPNEIIFGKTGALEAYTYTDLKTKLCSLIFHTEQYVGKYSNTWLRSLLPFFIKIQKHKKEKFLDPIRYIKEKSIAELNQYHFLFMGIDNTYISQNYLIQENLKQKIPALKEVKRLVQEAYNVEDIGDTRNEIDKLNRDIEKLEVAIQQFQLEDQYKDTELEANVLTKEIKDKWFENFSDRKKIVSYKESFNLDTTLSPRDLKKIQSLYDEANELLGNNIKKTLEQAISYRKQLSESRKEFISQEIKNLESKVDGREAEIINLSKKRAELFDFLGVKEAIKDLTEAFSMLSEKKGEVSDLEAKLKTYDTLEFEKLDLEKEEKLLEIEIKKFISEIQTLQVPDMSKIFLDIYNSIYPEAKDPLFSINENFNMDAKIEIKIEFPAMFSKGKNQGRTLVYDLAVLFHAIEKNITCPRFLIHDGIFDGMDKAHLVHLYEYLEDKKTTKKFQYIITLNEEGTLTGNFGSADKINPENIAKEAIIVLTPSKKLFNTDY
ncbi:DUF2326 domain-containing protein [Candidatus Roizmanbacteria bacterium]|nr:DUF2326 domain-containing protein [Candidatus Roizmanbacteria bacterium]